MACAVERRKDDPTSDQRALTAIAEFIADACKRGFTGKGLIELSFNQGGIGTKEFSLKWIEK